MTYGKIIKDLKINGKDAPYAVVNEREIRAAAGIMFLVGISTFFIVIFSKNFMLLNIVVTIFWLDFFLKTIFAPRYSIFGFLGSLMVKGQCPEYVGAIQKRFAWAIGLLMATAMMIGPVFMEIRGTMPIVICSICLFFMWMETALGICVGCKMYAFMLNRGYMKSPKVKPVCPGGVCSINRK